jgi:hypothetical protein
MTTQRFKEIEERNRHNPIVLCYEYFREEKNSNMDLQTFQDTFSMWCMMMSGGNANNGVARIVEYLKNKYK